MIKIYNNLKETVKVGKEYLYKLDYFRTIFEINNEFNEKDEIEEYLNENYIKEYKYIFENFINNKSILENINEYIDFFDNYADKYDIDILHKFSCYYGCLDLRNFMEFIYINQIFFMSISSYDEDMDFKDYYNKLANRVFNVYIKYENSKLYKTQYNDSKFVKNTLSKIEKIIDEYIQKLGKIDIENIREDIITVVKEEIGEEINIFKSF